MSLFRVSGQESVFAADARPQKPGGTEFRLPETPSTNEHDPYRDADAGSGLDLLDRHNISERFPYQVFRMADHALAFHALDKEGVLTV